MTNSLAHLAYMIHEAKFAHQEWKGKKKTKSFYKTYFKRKAFTCRKVKNMRRQLRRKIIYIFFEECYHRQDITNLSDKSFLNFIKTEKRIESMTESLQNLETCALDIFNGDYFKDTKDR